MIVQAYYKKHSHNFCMWKQWKSDHCAPFIQV